MSTTAEEVGSSAPPSENMSEIPLERVEAGASLPAPDEIRTDNNSRHRPSSLNTILCYSVFFVLLLACFVGLGVGLSNRGGSVTSSNADRGNVRKFSFESLADYMEKNGISSLDDLYSFATPQAQAARWLANEDPRNLNLPSVGINDKQGYDFITRYVLAVMYYSLSGPSWRFQFDFLTENDVCSWRGILYTRTGTPYNFGALCDSTGVIRAIYLDQNFLNGVLPTEITALTSLRELNFDFNDNIRGRLPADIGKLSLLQRLTVSFNQMTGPIPTSICDATFLQYLHLRYNKFAGNIPGCIGQLQNLQLLFLGNNLLSGPVPTSLSNLTRLQMVMLDDNLLSGDLSTTFDTMPQLQIVFVEDNYFQGTLDENFLANHPYLVQVDLSNNNFIGHVPDHFFDPQQVPMLEMLDFHSNRLTGELPQNITKNIEMNFLSFYGNSIRGGVPESWTNLEGLFHLDLSSNLLEGTMPEILGNLTGLSYLFLANNTFTPGPIPDSYAQLTQLEEFSAKRTNRTGPLPEWIVDWEDLILLDLDNNNFDGVIPESYGNLTKLQFLLLNRNNLQGQLPPSFSKMTNLRAIFLEKNALTGRLDILCDLPNFQEVEGDDDGTEIIAADCVGDESAQIVCKCCKICCVSDFTSGQDEGLVDEVTCHDSTAIANLNPIWESVFDRSVFDFGNETRFTDREYLN